MERRRPGCDEEQRIGAVASKRSVERRRSGIAGSTGNATGRRRTSAAAAAFRSRHECIQIVRRIARLGDARPTRNPIRLIARPIAVLRRCCHRAAARCCCHLRVASCILPAPSLALLQWSGRCIVNRARLRCAVPAGLCHVRLRLCRRGDRWTGGCFHACRSRGRTSGACERGIQTSEACCSDDERGEHSTAAERDTSEGRAPADGAVRRRRRRHQQHGALCSDLRAALSRPPTDVLAAEDDERRTQQ